MHYEKWEDYKAGMFALTDVIDKDKKVIGAIQLLSNEGAFYDILKEVMIRWENATSVNLTNKGQNRRAWLGAAACMFKCNTPEYLTRIAWNLLNKDVQDKANAVAEKIIMEFENKTSHAKTLFE